MGMKPPRNTYSMSHTHIYIKEGTKPNPRKLKKLKQSKREIKKNLRESKIKLSKKIPKKVIPDERPVNEPIFRMETCPHTINSLQQTITINNDSFELNNV
jgi:hypothetical protein